jgi:hypothetical protein
MARLIFQYRPPARREQPVDQGAARMSAEADQEGFDDGKRDRWWYESSYDLRCGLEVDDSVGQTIPGEVIDKLFNR